MPKRQRFMARRYKADRLAIALALYPRYLDFMEAHSGDDGLPVYDFSSAAGDALRAADFLIEALKESAK